MSAQRKWSPAVSPAVSIGLPVYNGACHLEQAIASLLCQTHADFELIISDNASTDATPELMASFAKRDPRIRSLRQERNLGAAANFNLVFHAARAPLFMWAGADDWREPNYLQSTVSALEREPAVVLANSAVQIVREDGTPLRVQTGSAETTSLSLRTRVRGLGANSFCFDIYGLMRSDVLRRTQLLRPVYGPDYPLVMEMALQGAFARVDEPLLCYRLRPEHDLPEVTMAKTTAEAARTRAVPGVTSILGELIRTIHLAPLPRAEKLLLSVLLATGPEWRQCLRHDNARALARALKQRNWLSMATVLPVYAVLNARRMWSRERWQSLRRALRRPSDSK